MKLFLLSLILTIFSGCSLFRPSTFRTEDLTFRNETGLRLTGTLYTPMSAPPYPLMLIAHGSGDFKRSFGFYSVYGEYFASRGIATFVYDKRGVGDSEGHFSSEEVYFDSLASDLSAAFKFISANPKIKRSACGILGISQAAWVIPQALQKIDSIAFVVAVSAPSVPPYYSDSYELGKRMLEKGYSEQDALDIVEYNRVVSRYVGTFAGRELAMELKRRNNTKPWFKELGYSPSLSPEDTLRLPQYDHYRRAAFDPAPFWTKSAVSTLLVFGDKDSHIPVDTSALRYRDIFQKNNFTDFEIKRFADAGHLIQQVDGVLEQVEPSLVSMVLKGFPKPKPEYLQFVEAWVKTRIDRSSHQ
jgi:pimeloyl-ACP methyl ester carboxylesterase